MVNIWKQPGVGRTLYCIIFLLPGSDRDHTLYMHHVCV